MVITEFFTKDPVPTFAPIMLLPPPDDPGMPACCWFSRRCYSQPHPFGKIESISPNGRVVPPRPQLAGL